MKTLAMMLTVTWAWLACASALESVRVALVIGNGSYAHSPTLRNPANDAVDVAAALRGCGFRLVGDGAHQDLGNEALHARLAEFRKAAAEASVALFFFAGHGVEVEGANYLLPVDAKLDEKFQVRHRTLALEEVLETMAGTEEKLKIVILDCCRDNPLARSWSRSGEGGLAAPARTPGGTVLLYATAPGRTAEDGTERNSPFSAVLKTALPTPGRELEQVFKEVGATVKRNTGGVQEPWMNSSFYGSFAFVPAAPQPDLAAMLAAKDAEIAKLKRDQAAVGMRPSVPAPAPLPVATGFGAGTRAGEMRTMGGIEMIWCPPGTFLMGSPETEADRYDDETQHEVTLTKGFWLAKTECTQAQWSAVMGSKPSNFPGDDLPVEQVSWEDATAWCQKMNTSARDLTPGMKWTLPTEAQWEYACRAGTTGPYAGTSLEAMGWYSDNAGSKTNPVGKKQANPWGLCDMHGNVYEWSSDYYDEAYDTSSAAKRDPQGPATGSLRVARGGSWSNYARYCRSAYRDWNSPGLRDLILGFRPAVSLP